MTIRKVEMMFKCAIERINNIIKKYNGAYTKYCKVYTPMQMF